MMRMPTIDMVKTGQKITELRIQNGLSVKELQEIFGFTTPQAIYKWQHGTAIPTVDNLVVLAQVGIVIFIGVLLDTLVVRTLLIPALVQLLGEKFWWPGGVKREAVDVR